MAALMVETTVALMVALMVDTKVAKMVVEKAAWMETQ